MNVSLWDVRSGESLLLNGIEQRVERVDSFYEVWQDQTSRWFELKVVDMSGAVSYLTWFEDKPDIYLCGPPSNIEDFGLTLDMLERFDDNEGGEFVYDNRTYYYKDSGDATCIENCSPNEAASASGGENFYYWDFLEPTQEFGISIEQWDDGIRAYFNVRIDPGIIEMGGE